MSKPIDAASAFIFSLNSTKLDINSLADGIQRYSQEWFKLDQYYRKFIYHLRESKQPSLLHALNTLIENLYSNNYLLTLNDRWQVFVDNASTWDSTSFPSQRQFFNRSVKPFLERNAKVCVISRTHYVMRSVKSYCRWCAKKTAMMPI